MATEVEILNELYKEGKKQRKFLTKEEFGKALGYTRVYFTRITNGHHPMPTDLIQRAKELIYDTNIVSHEINENNNNYLEKRRDLKNNSKSEGIIYVPVTAQAGYGRRYKEPVFINNLELAYLPGTKYKGKKYRLFEVEGESMEKTLFDGQKVIAEYVEMEDWQQKPNYYIYVLVSEDMISIKRVFRKDRETWVLISDNEDFYPQFIFDVKHLKELWIVKEKIDWNMAPPKKFEITV